MRILRAVCVLLLGIAAGSARAQSPVDPDAPIQYADGPNGILVGHGRLHPFFELELDYDSAAGLFPVSGSTTVYALSPELLAHFRPGFRLNLPSSENEFRLFGALDYVDYTGLLTPGSRSASRLDVASQLLWDYHYQRPVELLLTDTLARSDRTQDVAIGVGVISLYNKTAVRVPLRPGGGALEISPHLDFAFEQFEPQSATAVPGCSDPVCQPSLLAAADSRTFSGGVDGKWKFLPKTAVVLQTNLVSRTYAGPNPEALLFSAEGGLVGLLTSRLALVLKLGWVQDLDGSGLSTLIGQAEVDYAMSDTSSLKLGYLREGDPVSAYGTYLDNRPYLAVKMLAGGKLILHGKLSYDRLTFFEGSGRVDNAFTAELGPDYPLFPWLLLGLDYRLTGRSSTVDADSVNFLRHELLTRLTLTY